MAENEVKDEKGASNGMSRRAFVAGVGGVGAAAVLGGGLIKHVAFADDPYMAPPAEGYLVVDPKRCAGCASCMLACATVHEGVSDIGLSRIQVIANPFGRFGVEDTIVQEQCRQCPHPFCAEACPTGAMHAEITNGNTRQVDTDKCIGCERCIEACPFTPSRVQWNPRERSAQKCDLCQNTPFMTEDGGVGGVQACVAVCPTHAIEYVTEMPTQDDSGYQVNLRKDSAYWKTFNMPTEDDGSFAPAPPAEG